MKISAMLRTRVTEEGTRQQHTKEIKYKKIILVTKSSPRTLERTKERSKATTENALIEDNIHMTKGKLLAAELILNMLQDY